MPVFISSTIRISVPVGDETVVLICRQPTAAEMSEFLKGRFAARGKKVESHLYEAREALMRKVLLNVENAAIEMADGSVAPLTAGLDLSEETRAFWAAKLGKRIESWIDLVPLTWLSSGAMHFEDAAPEGEAGN